MQTKHGYKIINDCGYYYFSLFPTNNNNQEIGHSTKYTSYSECTNALSNFRKHIKIYNINSVDSAYTKLSQSKEGICCCYTFSNKTIFTTRIYVGSSAKRNCCTCVNKIHQYIDEYTTINKSTI